jgi:hypothetical protein
MTVIRRLTTEDDYGDLVDLSKVFFREYEAHDGAIPRDRYARR